ncbi:MAG TPA: hypothetical protein VIL86_16955 [Tepidisphaeraceae bacterium]|jgi:hypothetical protein
MKAKTVVSRKEDRRVAASILLLLALLTGCIANHPASPAPSATDVDARQAKPEYWMNQPRAAQVKSASFDAAWTACRSVLRDCLFVVDRQDFREGVMTSQPLISKQFFEPWRRDVATVADEANASLATYRRTVRFEISKQSDGSYMISPKVLIERLAAVGRRITTPEQFRNAADATPNRGSAEADEGIILPPQYWYATGRDTALEKNLAVSLRKRLGKRLP